MSHQEIESRERQGAQCVEALRKNGFDAVFLPDRESVRARILAECEKARSIGFGGSVSITELGIKEALAGSGKLLLDHGKVPPGEKQPIRLAQLTCDLFLSSANAVTLDGRLINLDGVGNRTNALTFGPGKIIIAAGINKIAADVQEGIRRIKTIAAPMNAKRLNLTTPCVASGLCEECDSPQRICRVYSIIERKPLYSDMTVLLCGEPMGY